jgi:hypothetical protein
VQGSGNADAEPLIVHPHTADDDGVDAPAHLTVAVAKRVAIRALRIAPVRSRTSGRGPRRARRDPNGTLIDLDRDVAEATWAAAVVLIEAPEGHPTARRSRYDAFE